MSSLFTWDQCIVAVGAVSISLLCELNWLDVIIDLTYTIAVSLYDYRMTSVMFVHPFDLVKNRMQLSGK